MNYQPVHTRRHRASNKPNRLIIAGASVAVGVLVIAAALVTNQDGASSAPATTTTQPAARPVATHKPTSATALRGYLKDNFADATWYPRVRKVEFVGKVPWITTTLTSHAGARPVCSAVSAWAIQRYGKDHFPGVSVRDRNGVRLVLRTSLGQAC